MRATNVYELPEGVEPRKRTNIWITRGTELAGTTEVALQSKPGEVPVYCHTTCGVFRFMDLTAKDLKLYADPGITDIPALFSSMMRRYPGFGKREIVTVLSFYVK